MRTPTEYCDCGHGRSAHVSPFSPGGAPGRCLHCRCEGWHERNVWVTDEPKREFPGRTAFPAEEDR